LTSEVLVVDYSELNWRKSSRSGAVGGGNCVEVASIPTSWRKSTYSGSGGGVECVEVAALPLAMAVRDSKNPDTGVLTFPSGPWTAFLNSRR
jgi:Domain of unknown function (DUF397)